MIYTTLMCHEAFRGGKNKTESQKKIFFSRDLNGASLTDWQSRPSLVHMYVCIIIRF